MGDLEQGGNAGYPPDSHFVFQDQPEPHSRIPLRELMMQVMRNRTGLSMPLFVYLIILQELLMQNIRNRTHGVSNMSGNGAGGGTTDGAGVTREITISVADSDSLTKFLLILLGVSGCVSWSAYPVIEKADGPAFAPLAYSFLCLLIIILAVGSFVTVKFDKAPWSKVFGKYVLLLSLVILVGLPTWVLISLILAART